MKLKATFEKLLEFIFSLFVNLFMLEAGAALYIVSMAQQGHPLPLSLNTSLALAVALLFTAAQYIGRFYYSLNKRLHHEETITLPVSHHPGA